jgi:ACT domain-containing protein
VHGPLDASGVGLFGALRASVSVTTKEAPGALQGFLTPLSKVKMNTTPDHERHIVNVTVQVE